MSIKSSFSNHSSQIFLVTGIIGFVGSIVTTVMKSDKVKPIVVETKKQLKEVSVDDPRFGFKSKAEERLYKTQLIGKAAFDISKEMAVPIGMALVSTGCLLKSYNIMNEKHLAAVSTISALDAGYKRYKNAVYQEVGEETAKKIDDNVIKKEIVRQIESVCKGDNTICQDVESFSRYFSKGTSNKFPDGGADTVLPFLKSQETYFNQLLHLRERFGRPGVVRYNEVLDALGFPKVPEGETAGWISYGGDGSIDFGIAGAYHTDYDGLLDEYNCVRDPEKIPRSDSGYMLCFNVDPYIVK